MNLQEYQLLTNRTNTDLGSKAINASHMVLGIVGEWEEMCQAVGEDFYTEAEAVMWYISELANLFDIRLESSYNPIEPIALIAWIAENVKKYLAYKKEIDIEILTQCLNGLVYTIKDVDDNEFENILFMNIEKLQKRFPDSFSSEMALKN